jgi:AAA15 family ATPase/GTPase
VRPAPQNCERNTVRLESITFKGFPPFSDATFDFPARKNTTVAEVQIITGQNGTGKTRLLSALSSAFGNSLDLDSRFTVDEQHDILVSARCNNLPLCFWCFKNRGLQFESDEDREAAILQFKSAVLPIRSEISASAGNRYSFALN